MITRLVMSCDGTQVDVVQICLFCQGTDRAGLLKYSLRVYPLGLGCVVVGSRSYPLEFSVKTGNTALNGSFYIKISPVFSPRVGKTRNNPGITRE